MDYDGLIFASLGSFRYEINGPGVRFLGTGAQHDTSYEHLAMTSTVNALRSFAIKNSSYTGIPVNRDYCPFQVTVYPSQKMRVDYNTTDRVMFPVMVVIIFAFTSGVFVAYDWHVRRRQRHLLATALDKSFNCNILETMVKDRTRELEQANQAVIRSARAQLQHFACMSHEIRTPLNSIIGYASLLIDTDLDTMQKESITTIVNSGELLLSIVNDVLDYSKLETGNVDIEIKPTDLQELVTVVVRTMSSKAKSSSLQLLCQYDSSQLPSLVKTDGWRLQQVLYNLLSNACKFSKEGGTVQLEVSRCDSSYSFENNNCYFPPNEMDRNSSILMDHSSHREHRDIHQRRATGCDGPMLRFTVKDFGKGIASSDFAKIFLPFLQAGGSEDESIYGGSGLGLAITSKLVHRLGGEIYVESQLGEWTQFTVEFPCDECATAAESSTSPRISVPPTVAVKASTLSASYDTSNGVDHQKEGFTSELSLEEGKRGGAASIATPFAANTQINQEIVPYCELKILIAEDNKVNQKVLLRMLNRLGADKVVIVENGKEAVKREESEPFDIVLMDMQVGIWKRQRSRFC
jgi:signal transduction histidine kinase